MFTNYLFGKKDTSKEFTKNNTEDNIDISCRICLDTINISIKDYYSPCQCRGTSGLIHKVCYADLYKNEKRCGACLTDYPPSIIKVSDLGTKKSTTPSVKEILEGFSDELNRILYDMGSYSEIQKVYNLFTSETDFFTKLSENYLKINNIKLYGLNNEETINYIIGGARLPRTTTTIDVIDVDNTDENYDIEEEIDDLGMNIDIVPYGPTAIIDENDDDDETFIDEDIAEDILNALYKINSTVYNYCSYNQTIEPIHIFNHTTHLGTLGTVDLTIKEFKEVLNKYYVDISYHSLNYLAKNPIKVYQLMIINSLYNLIKVIKNLYKIFGPDKINNFFGLLLIESMPFISYKTKAKWNKDIVNEITNGEVESASYFENSIKKLRYWKLDLLGYGIQSMNYLVMFLSLYSTYSGVKYVSSYVF
jgi:hypothetical protein